MDKHAVAGVLEEMGLLLELKGENPFKCQAYYNAARTIRALEEDLAALVASGEVLRLNGIGRALVEKLAELVGTGRLAYYEDLKREIPPTLLEMAAVPGLSPKKAMAVWTQLGIATLGELEYACLENRLVGLPGFGKKTQDKIQRGILQYKKRRGFHLYAKAAVEAKAVAAALGGAAGVSRVELAGDLRRRMEIVRSIDLVAAADQPAPVLQALKEAGLSELTVEAGRILGRSPLGIPVLLHILPRVTGHPLLGLTGSDAHLHLLAGRAAERGLAWNLDRETGPLAPAAEGEAGLYAALGLPYIEPELREGRDEIAWAESGAMPALVEADAIQGIFHVHTTASDGSATLEEMVEAAKALGYRYIGISDHSQSAFYANGLKDDRIREQHAAIDALRKRIHGIAIFKGIEADILPDGSLDYPDEILARFDFVIGSVHSRFNLPAEEQTRRVERALANPFVTILGHPTGRLLLSRDGYHIDMQRVLDAAAAHGKTVEINANPHRLDLDWRQCADARAKGVKVSINPDAHAVDGLADVVYGVNVARKGGLTRADVVNTLGSEEVLPALARAGAGS